MSDTDVLRIKQKVKELLSSKQRVETQLMVLEERDKDLKSRNHRLEIDILLAANTPSTNKNPRQTFHQFNTLRSNVKSLREDERLKYILKNQLADISRQYAKCTYWLKVASNGDALKQDEAVHRVFG